MSTYIENIESIPEARLLLRSLRSVGYTEETAIADIIDNCIAAAATEIQVFFDWENQRILIVDNGEGMTKDNLIKNMRIGSSDPNEPRTLNDLGRFGMGMKTAAFSLGKKLTVVSKTDGCICNASWDLDAIIQIGWNLIIKQFEDIREFSDKLDGQGTVIIIETLDRLIELDNPEKSKKRFFAAIGKISRHIGLTFHRYITIDGISFKINGNVIDAWDPFITSNSATQELADEVVWSDSNNSQISIQPYVLPHKTKFACESDFQNAGGAKGWNYHQGIYLYRNKRLIMCGTWFDYIKKEPAYNLARIKIDISSDSDEDWKIDIKKSSAAVPLYAKETIERVIDLCTEVSARVYNSRGSYTKSNAAAPNLDYVWEQRKKNGRYSFCINRKHVLLADIQKQLDSDGKSTFAAYLALVENYAPFLVSGVTDSMQKNIGTKSQEANAIDHEVELNEIRNYITLFLSKGFSMEETKNTLLEMVNYRHLRQDIITMMEAIQ